MKIPSMENYGISAPDTKEAYSGASASPDAFGAGVGGAMQGLAGQMNQAIDVAGKIKSEMSALAVEDKYNNEISTAFRDLDREYTKQMGKNAVDGYDGAIQKLQEFRSKALDTISDPQEQMMMNKLLNQRYQQSQDSYARHLDQQFRVYKEDTFTASRAMTVQNGVDFAHDPVIFDQYRRTNEHLIDDYGLQNGWSGEKIAYEQRKDRDALVSSAVQSLVQTSPMQAMAFLNQHQGQISPEILGKTRKMLDPYLEEMEVNNFIKTAQMGGAPVANFDIKKPTTQPSPQIKAILEETADRYHVPRNLVQAVAHAESTFDPTATSPAGAVGLMQLMPETAKELGVHPNERTDPAKSADGGVRYLAQMLNKYGNNIPLALGAYNAGPGNMDKAIAKAGAGASWQEVLQNLHPKTQKETIPYVNKILKLTGGEQEAPSKSPIPPLETLKTAEQIEEWRTAMTAQTGGIRQSAQIARINQDAGQALKLMKARNEASDRVLNDEQVKQLEETGVFDLTTAKLNPQFVQAWDNATPEYRARLAEKTISDKKARDKEVLAQEKDAEQQASDNRFKAVLGAMLRDYDYAKNVNISSFPELTASHFSQLANKKEEILKQSKEQYEGKELHSDLKQAEEIFDDVYRRNNAKEIEQTAGKVSGNKNYKNTEKYLSLQGYMTEAVIARQKMNGNKPVPMEEKLKIANDVFVKHLINVQGVVYKDVASALPELKKIYPDASPAQLQGALQKYLEMGQGFKGETDLKKALTGGSK